MGLQAGNLQGQPEAPPGRGVRHRQGRAGQGRHRRPGQARHRRVPGRHAVSRRDPQKDPFAKPDLQKAKQLMQEAGYQGEKIVLTAHLVPTDRPGRGGHPESAPGRRLQREGGDARVRRAPGGLQQRRFELFYSGSRPARTRTSTTASNESKSSQARYNNPEWDRLCQEGRRPSRPRTEPRCTCSSSSSDARSLLPHVLRPADRRLAGERQGLQALGGRLRARLGCLEVPAGFLRTPREALPREGSGSSRASNSD